MWTCIAFRDRNDNRNIIIQAGEDRRQTASAGRHLLQHHWPLGSARPGNAGTGISGLLSSHAEA